LESFLVWYTTENSFIIGVDVAKSAGRGLRSLKALEFEKWKGLEPRSHTEVYAYDNDRTENGKSNSGDSLSTIFLLPVSVLQTSI